MNIYKRKRTISGQVVESQCWYMHLQVGGQQVNRSTGQTDRLAAEAYARKFRDQARGDRARRLLDDTNQRAGNQTGKLIELYRAAGCPDRRLRPRVGTALAEHERLLLLVESWWSAKHPSHVTAADCDDYRTQRRADVAKKTAARARQGGDRTIELEIQALSNCYSFAVRNRQLDRNPIEKRVRYTDTSAIRHSRDCMPSSADELHRLAGQLFQDPRGECAAWAYLLESYTGLRTAEVRQLRAGDSARRQGLDCPPGCVDERYLHVHRLKHGVNPRIRLDDPERPEIRPLLERIHAWRAVRWPDSQWLIPGRGGRQMAASSLSHSLQTAVAALKLLDKTGQPLPRTSHGARAYYASVRLAQGHEPDEVARELGQRSGDSLVRDVYGLDPDDYHSDMWTSLAAVFTWLPATVPPAWEIWRSQSVNAPENIISL